MAILERTQQPAVAARLTDNDEEKLLVLNTLAAFHVQDAASERDATRRDVALSEVTKWVSRANRIENNSLSQTVSALSSLVSEDLARAELYLKEASEDTLAILLVKAAVHYNKGEFTQALRLYGKGMVGGGCVCLFVCFCFFVFFLIFLRRIQRFVPIPTVARMSVSVWACATTSLIVATWPRNALLARCSLMTR